MADLSNLEIAVEEADLEEFGELAAALSEWAEELETKPFPTPSEKRLKSAIAKMIGADAP